MTDNLSKPLCAYIDHEYNPGNKDEFILDELQYNYGVALEALNKLEKLYLILLITSNMIRQSHVRYFCREEIYQNMGKIHQQLTQPEMEGLLEALIDGVRYQPDKNYRQID